MKKFKIIILLLSSSLFFPSFGENKQEIYIMSADTDTDRIEIENPAAISNVQIPLRDERLFRFSAQAGYGNIFTSKSLMHGVYLGFFSQYEDKDMSSFLSFKLGIRANIYFNNSFEIGDDLYTLNTGICINFPATVQFKVFQSAYADRRVDLFIGVNPQIFELADPQFIITAMGGLAYRFNSTYYTTASYEHSLNQEGRIGEVNVGIGYRF